MRACSRSDWAGLNGFNLTGDGLVLLSAVSAGAGALVSRIYTPGRDPMLLTGWQLLIGGCFLLGVGTMGGGALGRVTLGGVLLLGYMIVLSAAAFTIWNWRFWVNFRWEGSVCSAS